ncbi:MAG: GxxExxY protein [Pontiellaceae bacterium]|nr:GxxExxY protein [Pontiellaceae bacterium]
MSDSKEPKINSREAHSAVGDKEISRETAKNTKEDRNDGSASLRAFASSRATISHDQNPEISREAAKNTKEDRNDGSASLRAFASSREPPNLEDLSAIVVDCAYKLHVEAGPGLLESVYEAVLAKMLKERGLKVKRQVPVPIHLMGMEFDEGFRADILVEDIFLIELKSVERLAPVHSKQTLTYLRLMNLSLGLLINFGAATFKEGIKRIVNHHQDFASSRLRVNQIERGAL